MSLFISKPQHNAIITSTSSSSVAIHIPAGTTITTTAGGAITHAGSAPSYVHVIRSYSGYYHYLNLLMRRDNVQEIDAELYEKLGRDPTCEEIQRAVLLRKSALGKKLYE